jgi:hypothetical protein
MLLYGCGYPGISVGKSPAFSYSASRYSYSKTFESMQGAHLFKEAESPVFGPYVNYIPSTSLRARAPFH